MERLIENVTEIPVDQQERLVVAGVDGKKPRFAFAQVYAAGALELLKAPRVAIVGTRKVSAAGAKRARDLAHELVAARVVVVSGLAEGVDTAAHTAAIAAKGRTIAVIGTALDKAYPASNARLQEQIYREHLLISPFPNGQRTYPKDFPQRNKVMAAMTDATIIIEASDTSGTIHQAAECQRLGRLLFIAREVLDDTRVTWPARFRDHRFTRILDRPEDVLREISAGAF